MDFFKPVTYPLNEFCMTHIVPSVNNMLRLVFFARFEYLIY